MAQDHADLDPATIAHLTHHALIREPDGSLRWKYDNAARVRAPDDADGHDLDQALSAVACPVTLLYGDSGWIPVPPADRLKRLADHRLIRFAGAGHWLHHAQRGRFLDVLQSFVSQHTKDLCHA
jgi:pimeloyl-ACP methyl ester carboxylesterase